MTLCMRISKCVHVCFNFYVSISTSQVSSTLSIPMSLFSDSGRYQCSVENSIRGLVLSDYAEIIIRGKLIMYNTYHVIFGYIWVIPC